MSKLIVIAVGGNALIRPGEHGTADGQFANALETAGPVVELIEAGYKVVLTHGNGPQVGAALTRSEIADPYAYRLPYDCCVASTQGEIGYVLQYALWQLMQRKKVKVPVVTIITQVRVDRNDPAFQHPTKPIGPYLPEEIARRYQSELGWTMLEDPQRGFRRVVPSPEPREIVELDAIKACVDRGLVVIAAGGGGVPVFNDHDITKGVEAVVDKDLTSALLASRLRADILAIVTGEPNVFLNYGKPRERALTFLDIDECRRYMAEGQFPEGSMGPKIQAALAFLDERGDEVIITDIPHLGAAVEGRAGTHIQTSREMIDWP